jgi:TolB-like protein
VRLLLLLALLLPSLAHASAPTLAITYFDNNSPDDRFDPLGHGLADMLITDLANVGSLQVVERRRLSAVLDELKLQESSFIDPKTAVQVGKGLGANYVLVGAFTTVEPTMRIDARIVDVASSQVVRASSVSGPYEEFFLLEKELAAEITDGLSLAVSARESAKIGRIATESFDAFLAYSRGLAALDRGALSEATGSLRQALELDDRFGRVGELLGELRDKLRRAGERQVEVANEVARGFLALLTKLEASGGPYDAIGTELVPLSTTLMFPSAAKDLGVIAGRLLDLKIPEELRLGGPQGWIGVNEWAMYTFVQAAWYRKDRAEFLTYCDAYLERYPANIYAQSLGMQLRSLLDIMDKEKAGRDQMGAVLAEAKAEARERQCNTDRRPKERLDACRENVELRRQHGLELGDRALEAWARAAQHAGDGDALRAILASAKAEDPYSKQAETVADLLKRFDGDQADVDKARARLQEAIDKGRDPVSHQAGLARDLMNAGRWDEARSFLDACIAEHPGEERFYDLLVAQAVQIHDVDGAEAAIARWEASGVPLDAGRVRAVRDLPEQLKFSAQGEAFELLTLGSKLQQAGLLGEAADAWYRLGTEFADSGAMDPESALTLAASMYGQAWDLEGQWRSYSAVIERWPGTDAARAAEQMRAMIPEP